MYCLRLLEDGGAILESSAYYFRRWPTMYESRSLAHMMWILKEGWFGGLIWPYCKFSEKQNADRQNVWCPLETMATAEKSTTLSCWSCISCVYPRGREV